MATILLDMDGVLADFDGPLFKLFGHQMDIGGLEHQTERFLTEHLSKHDAKIMRHVVNSPGWFESLPVMPGAQRGVEEILSVGHDVWVCSKPLEDNPGCASEKFAWIRKHFPDLDGRLILAPEKDAIVGDVLIDDAIKAPWVGRASWVPIIFDHVWNREGKFAIPGAVRFEWGMDIDATLSRAIGYVS